MVAKEPKHEYNNQSKSNIFDLPEFLIGLPAKGKRGAAISLLNMRLKNAAKESKPKAVIYSATEFNDDFAIKNGGIKSALNNIKSDLKKKFKRNRVRHYIDDKDGRVYFWENKLDGRA